MKSTQFKKLIILGLFVLVLVGASVFLYNLLVKPSPYYPKAPETSVDE